MGILVNKLYGKTSSMATVSQAKAVYKGSTKVYKIYAGNTLVWHEKDTPVVSVIYDAPSIINLIYSDVKANGKGGKITVEWEQWENTYLNGTLQSTKKVYGASSPTDVYGKSVISGSGYSYGELYGPHCYDDETSRRHIYTIQRIGYYANGVYGEDSTNYYVYQEANQIESTTSAGGSPTLSLSGDTSTNIGYAGGSKTITVNATGDQVTKTYTSGYTKTDTTTANVSLSVHSTQLNASLNKTSITGSGTSTLTLTQNNSELINIIAVTATSGSLTEIIRFYQDGSVYELELAQLVANIGADGGTVAVHVKSTKNGSKYNIEKGRISISGISGATVNEIKDAVDIPNATHTITIDVPENTATSTRTAEITITQQYGKVLVVKVIQNAASSGGSTPIGSITIKNARLDLEMLSYEITVNSGTYDELIIRAASANSLDATVYSETTISNVSSGTYPGILRRIPTSALSVWILVIYKGNIVARATAMKDSSGPEIIG